MYRPRRDAGRAGRLEISPSPEPQQPTAAAECRDLELPTARPLRRNTRPGLISVSGPQAAQPTSRPPRPFVLPGITRITPDMPPARLSDMPPTRTRAPRAQPANRTIWSGMRSGGPPSLSSLDAPAAQSAQQPHSIPRERPPSLTSLSFTPTAQPAQPAQPAQHPVPHSYRSVGVQVNLAPPPAPPPAPPSATRGRRESRPDVTTTTKRAPWHPPRASTPFRHVRKSIPSGHASDTAINKPEATITSPATATNAPTTSSIHEFICLYSHDLRRKHKRWQDGMLRFYTFNQKYVVYDPSWIYVGDGHWQGDVDDFQEGLEIELDRPRACVQVIERTMTKEQDLSQVLGKRAREVEERRASRKIRSAPAAPIQLMPPKITGAWSKHAEDLLGRGRPIRG